MSTGYRQGDDPTPKGRRIVESDWEIRRFRTVEIYKTGKKTLDHTGPTQKIPILMIVSLNFQWFPLDIFDFIDWSGGFELFLGDCCEISMTWSESITFYPEIFEKGWVLFSDARGLCLNHTRY